MCVSVVVAKGLASHLQRSGVDPEPFWRQIGVTPEQAHDPLFQLSYRQVRDMMAALHALSDDPAVVLHAAQSAPTSLLALMGQLIANCTTLRDAYQVYQRYASLLTPDSRWVLRESGSKAAFVYEFPAQYAAVEIEATEAGMGLATAFGRLFLGSQQRNLEARFRYPAPPHVQAYWATFRCPLAFEASESALVFDRRTLDVRQLGDDHAAWSALHARAHAMWVRHNDATQLSDRVMTAVRHEPDLAEVTLDRVAKRLRMTARALRRRLHEEGKPFQVLLGEVRSELACEALRHADIDVRDISQSLGYSELSAFHRAFKRWHGCTPGEYRAQHARHVATGPTSA